MSKDEIIARSDDCASGLHEYCFECQCSCHKNELKLTPEEALALVIELQHTLVSLERQRIIYDLLGRLRRVIDSQK